MNAVHTVITLQGMRRHRLLLQISNTPATVCQLYLHHSISLQERPCVHLIKVKNDSEMKIIFLLLLCFCFSVTLQEAHLNTLVFIFPGFCICFATKMLLENSLTEDLQRITFQKAPASRRPVFFQVFVYYLGTELEHMERTAPKSSWLRGAFKS